ncbi:MAG: transglycosylase domain-containing protein, partial [Eubacteriales bacterium]
MNYGKNNIEKKQKDFASRKDMKQKRIGVRCFKAILLIVILLCIAVAVGMFLFLKNIIDSSPEITPDDVSPVGYSSFIVDTEGNELEKLLESGSNRIYTPIENIPEDLQNAFIAIEDSRFNEHTGIDPIGIVRAGLVGLANGGDFTEGASTITQQLIKNSVFVNFMDEETLYDRVERKIQEIYLALDLETQISKETILENYLNTINLGQSTLGVQSASLRYFDKDVSELTLSECAVIAGITKNPTGYNPITYPEANEERREKVLGDMLTQGYITQAEYDEAIADTEVYERIQIVNAQITEEASPYSYFTDLTIEQVLEDMQEVLGYTYDQAKTKLYSGGVTVVSTQDAALQQIVDEELSDDSNFPSNTAWNITYAITIVREDGSEENYWTTHFSTWSEDYYGRSDPLLYLDYDSIEPDIELYKESLNISDDDLVYENLSIVAQPQAAFVLMDQYTGEVKAIAGGRGEKTTSLSFNRADEPRQPGSTFKIVAAYAPALDTGAVTLATVEVDEAVEYPNGAIVSNYSNSYQGAVTIRYAIMKSLNTIAVKMYYAVTDEVVWEYLMDFGFTTLVHPEESGTNDYGPATALGGLTNGVTALELTAAYAAIANGGTYTEPILYTMIYDSDGSILIDNQPETHTVIKESTAALLTSAMQSVVTSGTGGYASIGSQAVAGKTGTTSDNKDVWFSGFTPYYTAALWFGLDQPYDMSNLGWYSSYHTKLWSAIMTRVHEDLPVIDFESDSTLKYVQICSVSGLLPAADTSVAAKDMEDVESIFANLAPGYTYVEPLTGLVTCPTTYEYFTEDTVPTEVCTCTATGHTLILPESTSSGSTNNNTSSNNTSSNTTTTTPDTSTDTTTPDTSTDTTTPDTST